MRSTLKIFAAIAASAILLAVAWSPQAMAVDTGTSDPTAVAPITLPPDTTSTTDNRSFFEKAGDFASNNATWFIVGIIALAVFLALIFILRGRKKAPVAAAASNQSGTGPAQDAPGTRQDAPSAAEIKRRRRASMQRAREEERLRRKAGLPAGANPAQALDPVAAEKHAAKTGTPQKPKAPVPPVSPEAPTEVAPAPGGIGAGAVVGGAAAAAAGAAAAGAIGNRPEEDDAEARLREKVEEIKAGQAAVTPADADAATRDPAQHGVPGAGAVAGGAAAAAAGAAAGAALGGRGEVPSPGSASGGIPVPEDLAEAEARIRADRENRDHALQEAEERLRLVEERAEAAERRAAFAEQLAQLKAEEGEQERRLREVMERMDRAEDRARQAELRAQSAERVASDALRGGGAVAPVGGSEHLTPPPAVHMEPPVPVPPPPAVEPTPGPAPTPGVAGTVNINTASFEELRGAEFSVTQATRVLAYRERFGGYVSIDDLARVPGFSPEIIASLRDRIST